MRLFFRLLLCLHLYAVEALAENTDNLTLRHKGIWIHTLDETEDTCALSLLCQNDKNLVALVGVPSFAIEHGDSAPC